MANEFQIIPAPDVEPILSLAGVDTGYVRQNTLLSTLQTVIDTTEPYDNGQGVITIPAGGVVEYNGVLFRITNNVTLTKPDKNIAYWIAINDNGDGTANPVLVTRPGAWNPAKQGCYDTQNRRTLNWVSLGSLYNLTESVIFSENVKGTWEINLRKGWYYVELASGKGGGNGGNGINGTGNTRNGIGGSGGIGGIPNKQDIISSILFFDGTRKLISVGGSGIPGGSGLSGKNGTGTENSGGGSGGGERSFIGEISTLDIPPGNGGKGGDGGDAYNGDNAFGVGGLSGKNGKDTIYRGSGGGEAGSFCLPCSANSGGGSGSGVNNGSYNSIGGAGGNGGDGGISGHIMPNGSPGGYCNVYPLGN